MTKCVITQNQWLVRIVVINDLSYNKYTLFEELNLVVAFVDLIIRYVTIVSISGTKSYDLSICDMPIR